MRISLFWNLDDLEVQIVSTIVCSPLKTKNLLPQVSYYACHSHCNQESHNWIWWCCIHHWHTTYGRTPSTCLQYTQIRRNYQYMPNYDQIHWLYHSWMGPSVHKTINLYTLRTQPMASPCKFWGSSIRHWKSHGYWRRMKTSLRLKIPKNQHDSSALVVLST